MAALKNGMQPPKRVVDQLMTAGLACHQDEVLRLSENGETALRVLT